MKLNLPLLLSVLICCNSAGQTKVFKNDQYQYEFEYPNDWTVKDWGQSSADVIAPDDHNEIKAWARVSISSESTHGRSLDECFKTYVTDLYPEQEKDFKIIRQGAVILNGKKTKWIESKFEKGGTLFNHLDYMVFLGDKFFMVTCSASEKRYPSYKEKFKGIIDSFTVSR
jgi:PsbP